MSVNSWMWSCVTGSALTLAACSGTSGAEWCDVAAEEVDPRVVSEVDFPESPAVLSQEWTIDGLEEGHELVMPSAVAIDPDQGRVAIADFGLTKIGVASLAGRWIGHWGQAGQGPGELGIPVAVRWSEDGALVVFDPMNSKLVHLSEDGVAAPDRGTDRNFSASLAAIAWAVLQEDGRVVAQPLPVRTEDGAAEFSVVRGGLPGVPVDTLATVSTPVASLPGQMPVPLPGWALPTASTSSRGTVAVGGDIQEYRVRVMDSEGELVAVLCGLDVEVETPPSREDLPGGDEVHGLEEALSQGPVPPRPAAVGRVLFDADDRLWVQRGVGKPLDLLDRIMGREGARYDVYDADLELLGVVEIPGRVRMIGGTGDLVVGLERGEFDELSIVGYRVVW